MSQRVERKSSEALASASNRGRLAVLRIPYLHGIKGDCKPLRLSRMLEQRLLPITGGLVEKHVEAKETLLG